MDRAQAMAEVAMRGAAEYMQRQRVEYTDEIGARICARLRSLLHERMDAILSEGREALEATNADVAATTVALSLFNLGIDAARSEAAA